MALAGLFHFDGFAGERVVVMRATSGNRSRAGDEPDAAFEPLSPALVRSLLRKWLADPVDRRTLVALYEATTFHEVTEPWNEGGTHVPMLEILAGAFEREELVVRALPDLPAPAIGPNPQPHRPTPIPQAKKSFIEIELLDANGKRVATELLVTLPDGSKMRPSFSGFLRIDGLDPGTCDIEFPLIDGREWGPSPFKK